MSDNSSAVFVGTTGAVYAAFVVGIPLPTAYDTALNVGFLEVGYISSDGVTESMNTDTNKIIAWQNGDIVREVQTSHELTYKFTCLETNPTVLGAYYGNYNSGTVEVNGQQPVLRSWVIDAVDGPNVIRTVLPSAQISDRGDVQSQNGDARMYSMTLTAYPDPDYSGAFATPAKAYQYLFDIAAGVS